MGYQARYESLCQHFGDNNTLIDNGFVATHLLDGLCCCHEEKEKARLYQLSLTKLARFVGNGLAETGLFQPEIKPIHGYTNIIQVGQYTPRGDVRFPILLSTLIAEKDDYALIRYLLLLKQPAMVLLPSTETISADVIAVMKEKGCLLVSLQQLATEQALLDLPKIQGMYSEFNQMHPDAKAQQQAQTFPTPAGARWQDIDIVLLNNHVARITCKFNGEVISYRYNYTQMGMNNHLTEEPVKAWELFLGFAQERGQFTWYNEKAHERQKSHKRRLEAFLKTFFGLHSSPFKSIRDDQNRVGYEALFNISFD